MQFQMTLKMHHCFNNLRACNSKFAENMASEKVIGQQVSFDGWQFLDGLYNGEMFDQIFSASSLKLNVYHYQAKVPSVQSHLPALVIIKFRALKKY